MRKPTTEEIDRWIVDAGYGGGTLRSSTVVLIRDVLRPTRFSSWACVRNAAGSWCMFPCRTVPTDSELSKAARHKDGTAIIAAGVINVGVWRPGYHSPGKYGKERPCLRQCAPIMVHRDNNGDKVPEWSPFSKQWDNARGINLHDWRGSSAGCPTMEEQSTVDALLSICKQNRAHAWDLLVIEPLFESGSI